MIHGEVVEYKEFVYLMMHKPQGVISATEDDNHETVIDLLELEDAILIRSQWEDLILIQKVSY